MYNRIRAHVQNSASYTYNVPIQNLRLPEIAIRPSYYTWYQKVCLPLIACPWTTYLLFTYHYNCHYYWNFYQYCHCMLSQPLIDQLLIHLLICFANSVYTYWLWCWHTQPSKNGVGVWIWCYTNAKLSCNGHTTFEGEVLEVRDKVWTAS